MKALTLAFQDDPRFKELKEHRDTQWCTSCLGNGSADYTGFDGIVIRTEAVPADRDIRGAPGT